MYDPEVIYAAFEASGFPAAELLEGIANPDVKQKLIENTGKSVSRGTFGLPTFFVADGIYFGKDKMRDVAIHRHFLLTFPQR